MLALVLTAGLPAKAQSAKDITEARAFYDRAQVFIKQEAWREAFDLMKKAEGKHKSNQEYVLAVAELSLRLHRPGDALSRYSRIYQANPANTESLRGLALTWEELQNYRVAVVMWKRYTLAVAADSERRMGQDRLSRARELFAANYEILENPAGGAENLLTPADELKVGLNAVQQEMLHKQVLFLR